MTKLLLLLFLFLMLTLPINFTDCNSINYGEDWVLKDLNTLRSVTAYCSNGE